LIGAGDDPSFGPTFQVDRHARQTEHHLLGDPHGAVELAVSAAVFEHVILNAGLAI